MTEPTTLLLVEDELLIRLTLQEVLEAAGYAVQVAANGHEAIALLDHRQTEIAGLVTDIKLGNGPSGWDVAHHARELVPSISVVYSTGDSADDWPAKGVPKSVVLQKPFADAQLVTAISMLLNEAGPPPNIAGDY